MSSEPYSLGDGIFVNAYAGPTTTQSRSRRRFQITQATSTDPLDRSYVTLSVEEADTLADYIRRNTGPRMTDE